MNAQKLYISLALTLGLLAIVGTLTLMGTFVGGPLAVRAQGTTRYVATVGTDSGDCSNSSSPCRTVQYAVDQAATGDEIRVAAGIYTDINARPRSDITTTGIVTQVVYVSKTVTIRGGYTTTNWTAPDPKANPTTLDAQGRGRVLYIIGDISPTIEGLRITGGNAAGLGGDPWGDAAGGGLYLYHSGGTIRGNQIFSNTAEAGGGLYLYSSDAIVQDNTFNYNSAWSGGGVMATYGVPTISHNTISNNSSSEGAGIHLHRSSASLSRSIIKNNESSWLGGGIYLYRESPTVSNNVIANNQANTSGAALYIEESSPQLLHNTVVCNTGGDGSGIYVTDDGWEHSTVALTNTILVSHAVGIHVTAGNTATMEATLWGSGAWANVTDTVGTVISSTNVTGDPAFVDPEVGNYHINSTSAAIDAGVNAGVSVDVDGESRPAGTGYDIGADEFWWQVYLPAVLRRYPPCSLINSDGFSDPTSGWPSQDLGVASYGYSNGEYRWWSNYSGASVWFLRTFPLPGNDFTAEIDARLATDTDTPMGLKFNFSLEGGHTLGYVFEVRPNNGGQYRLTKSGSPALIDWAATSDFNPYPNWNHLRVTRQGSNITLYLNGTALATISDNDYLGNGFMMDLATGSQVPAEVRYDNFALYFGVCP